MGTQYAPRIISCFSGRRLPLDTLSRSEDQMFSAGSWFLEDLLAFAGEENGAKLEGRLMIAG